jgi:hypothetical protein
MRGGGGRVGGMRGGGGRVGGMRGGRGGRERFTMPSEPNFIRSENYQETPDDFMGIL